jgi:hypothetical protein
MTKPGEPGQEQSSLSQSPNASRSRDFNENNAEEVFNTIIEDNTRNAPKRNNSFYSNFLNFKVKMKSTLI